MSYFNQLEQLTQDARYFIEKELLQANEVFICNEVDLLDKDSIADMPEFAIKDKENLQHLVVIKSMRMGADGNVEFEGVYKEKHFPMPVWFGLEDLNSEDIIYLADCLRRCLAN